MADNKELYTGDLASLNDYGGTDINANTPSSVDYETQKYLYQTGLADAVKDYKEQVGQLDANRQKEIENAYYTRELAKNYLGASASNQDIGDVSGRTLDIYGNFQNVVSKINQKYGDVSRNLKSSYNKETRQYELGLVEAQKGLEAQQQQQQLASQRQQIYYNLRTGLLPEEMNTNQYLDSVRNIIGDSQYWSFKAQYKLQEMDEVSQSALQNINQYKTQDEWNDYVEKLVDGQSISKEQAEDLKNYYEINKATTFESGNLSQEDIGYFAPNIENLAENAKTLVNDNMTLAETKTVVDSLSNTFELVDEQGKGIAYNTPFGVNGKWFVKELKGGGETVYKEYQVVNTSATTTTNITKDNDSYTTIDTALNKKNGVVSTNDGYKAYTYDEKTDSYKSLVDFQALSAGKKKGEYIVGGIDYILDKSTEQKNNPDLKNKIIKYYFNGNKNDFDKNVLDIAGYTKDSVIIIPYNNKFYTYNSGRFYKLKRK